MLCKFRNSGQTCITANRILVQDGVYDEFSGPLRERGRGVEGRVGFTAGVDVGPLIDEPALAKVERHVDDARERGAELLQGGRLEGQFFQPSVLTGVPADAAMSCEETFGPVAGIARFADEEAAVQAANDTPYGLAAYFYRSRTRDLARVRGTRVWHRRDQHRLHLDRGRALRGMKESGIGREARGTGWTSGSS